MSFQPYTVARYGIYAAAAVAVVSVLIGRQAGASFDFLLLRAVAVFVIVTALALAAEAVLSVEGAKGPNALPPAPQPLALDTIDNPASPAGATPERSTE